MNNFRNKGAIGAILDEYERAILELIATIQDVSDFDLKTVVDAETKDEDCRSVQSILTHLVQSGYTYVVEIRKWLGEEIEYRDKEVLDNVDDYIIALTKMFNFNEALFSDHPNIQLEEYNLEKRMTVRWGQNYDVEQLYEHAIVHILRHRRQIEKFKLKLSQSSTQH
jgi:hypothetical protein